MPLPAIDHAGLLDRPPDPYLVTDGARSADVGGTVLLVEDDATIRLLVGEVLADAGYRVLEAPNGTAGIHILRSAERIDLLITDVGLPGGLDGRAVADAGRSLRPGLKVLFVTGYAADGGAHPAGMDVLCKPFTVTELECRVHDLVRAGNVVALG